MQVQTSSNGYSWYRTRTATVKLNTGETLEGGPVEVTTIGPDGGREFSFYQHMGSSLSEVARAGRIVEVEFDGVRYRVLKLHNRPEHTGLICEPMGTAPVTASKPKPTTQDRILQELQSVPDGMTAREVSEKLDCTQRWVFSALAALMRAGRVMKDGARYRCVDEISKVSPCAPI